MTSLLNSIIDQTTPQAPKGIIYGPPGIGKTTFGAEATESLIVDCENGAGAIVCKRTPYLQSWNEILQWLQAIETGNHNYQVAVIDSIDWLLRRIEEHVSGCAGGKAESTLNRSHGGYGNGKQVFKNYVYQILLPLLDRIVARGIAVILLAHTSRTKITDVDGIEIEKSAPDLPDDFLNTFVEWSDFVCLARKDGEGKRQLVTEETPRAIAKNRYSLPVSVEMNWNVFTNEIIAGLERTANSKSESKQKGKE